MDHRIQIVKTVSELGAGARGASLAFDALRIAAIHLKNNFFLDKSFVDVADPYEDLFSQDVSPYLRKAKAIHTYCSRVVEAIETQRKKNKLPFVVSGDHSSALGIAVGLKKAQPEKRLGIIWIDAHFDIHSPFTTPSGNMHGMPIAAMLREDNKLYASHQLDETTIAWWEEFKNLYSSTQSCISKDDIFYFGVRSYEIEEMQIIRQLQIPNVRVEEYREWGVKKSMAPVIQQLQKCDSIYISFDVDCLDNKISFGTGTPERNGFTPEEVSELFAELIPALHEKIVCFEITELNTTLDFRNNTAEIAFKLMEQAYNFLSATHH